ncbi:hypothetical protein PsorP6_014958 [Peronosclerospora sorghi]|uniref:Uncharacterized protein n=1 Tax=Peronosclerospora sorghi TaxID=230839 RepID=A0ACC0VVJ4_9STRA|nr:hypothetical protein PsorP6_014958 [Peronosclerospora sorghi]
MKNAEPHGRILSTGRAAARLTRLTTTRSKHLPCHDGSLQEFRQLDRFIRSPKQRRQLEFPADYIPHQASTAAIAIMERMDVKHEHRERVVGTQERTMEPRGGLVEPREQPLECVVDLPGGEKHAIDPTRGVADRHIRAKNTCLWAFHWQKTLMER